MRRSALFLTLVVCAYAPAAHAQKPGWESLGRPAGADLRAVYGLLFDADTLYVGHDEGVFRLAPVSAGWSENLYYREITREVVVLTPDRCLIVGRGGNLDRKCPGETQWYRERTGVALFDGDFGGHNAGGLFQSTTGALLARTYYGCARSDDGGDTWLPTTGLPNRIDDVAQLPPGTPHAGRLVAAVWDGMYYSDDDGRTWAASDLSAPGQFRYEGHTVVSDAAGRLVANVSGDGSYGFLYSSDDGGASWTRRVDLVRPTALASPALGTPTAPVVFAVTDGGRVWRTNDGGQAWEELPPLFVEDSESPRVQDAAVGPDGRLYVSASRRGSSMEFGGLYRTTAPVVAVASEPGPIPAVGFTLSVSPNPSRAATTVTLHLAEAADVAVSVFDALGRRVAVLAAGRFAAGTHALRLDTATLPAGVYVVHATDGAGRRASRTVTVVR